MASGSCYPLGLKWTKVHCEGARSHLRGELTHPVTLSSSAIHLGKTLALQTSDKYRLGKSQLCLTWEDEGELEKDSHTW